MILDLRVLENVIIKLPNVFWKMQSLRQLYLPSRYEIEKITLRNLSNLEKIEGLDLDMVDVEGLEGLTSLQELSARCLEKKEGLYPFLRSSTMKRMDLWIGASMFVELSNILSGCHFLVGLSIDGERDGSIPVPVTCAEKIPQNLERLGVGNCEISEDGISALGKLRQLKMLALMQCYAGSELHISSNSFPELIHLGMVGLTSLRELTVERGGLPKLKKLLIGGTQQLMLPDTLPPQVEITRLIY